MSDPAAQSRFASPYLLLVLTMIFWAGNAVVGRAMHTLVPPVTMAFWRWTLALLLVLPFAARALYAQRRQVVRQWKNLLLLGALGIGAYNTILYVALRTTTATNGLLINAVTPVFVIVIARILYGERMTSAQKIGVPLSIAGVLAIVSKGNPAALLYLDMNHGDLYLLVASLCWASYAVALRNRPADLDAAVFLAAIMAVGVALLAPFYAWEALAGPHWTLTPSAAAGLAYFGIFPSLLAYLFWNRAVKEIGASRASFFLYLIPAFGIFLAMFFLGESLHLFHLAGIALIFAGVYLSTLHRTAAAAGAD